MGRGQLQYTEEGLKQALGIPQDLTIRAFEYNASRNVYSVWVSGPSAPYTPEGAKPVDGSVVMTIDAGRIKSRIDWSPNVWEDPKC